MGWMILNSRAEALTEARACFKGALDEYWPAHGNHAWFLMMADRGPVVMLCLLQTEQGDHGIKVMDETMGPYFDDCPHRMLDRSAYSEVGYAPDLRKRCGWKPPRTTPLVEALEAAQEYRYRLGRILLGAQNVNKELDACAREARVELH
jgi:hypothetical protein